VSGAADERSSRWILAAGGVLMALATIAGALGAHALPARLSAADLSVYDTAVRYQFFDALGLLAIGLAMRQRPGRLLTAAGALVLAGTLCFCGSIYLLVCGVNFGLPLVVGLTTPLGGLLLMCGWIVFAAGVWRGARPEPGAR